MHTKCLFVRLVFCFVFSSFLWCPLCLGAQTDIPEQNPPEDFYAYTLENGLELYVQEDFSVPVVKTDYTARAGTSYQEPETTGFYRLYSRLFWQSGSGLDAYKKAGAGNFKAECTSLQARYSFTAAVQNFEETFRLFAHSLKNPSFSDNAVQTEFSALKKESSAWSRSPGGFINTAVYNRVFAAAPWKKDSGVYPALFTKMNTEQIRAKLSYIQKKRYVPNQSALFISGPVNAEAVLESVQKELSDWERSYSPPLFSREKSGTVKKENEQKNFVLVSNDFSKDLNQVLIQYTAQTVKFSPAKKENTDTAEPIETPEIFSAAAWAAAFILQSKRETENIDISFTADGSDGRLSIQTLFAAGTNAKQDNPVESLNKLTAQIKEEVQNITEADLESAKKYARLLQQEAFKGVHPFIDALSENWAYGGIEYFYEWPRAVENVSLQDVQNVFVLPRTFLIVHSSQYKLYEKEFTESGCELVKPEKETLNFPSGTAGSKTASGNTADRQGAKQATSFIPESETALENYGAFTKQNIETLTLSSGIPVSIQKLPNTAWTVCVLGIKGGELKHGYAKKGLESIALLNLVRTVEDELYYLYEAQSLIALPQVKTSAGLFSSTLSVSYAVQDTEAVLGVLAAAFKNMEPTPAQADELYFAEAYRRRTESASADAQLKEAALETFFGGTDAEPFFKITGDTPPAVTYAEIRDACVSVCNPDSLNLIFCGNTEADIKELAERYFGKESAFYTEAVSSTENADNNQPETPVPAFSQGERLVRLHRLFFTDIPAELAGNRPAKLIPTTDFADPAQLYLKSPPTDSREEVLFAALLQEIAYRMTTQFELASKNEKNTQTAISSPPAAAAPSHAASPAVSVSALGDIEGFPLASLHFVKVKSKKGIKKAFKTVVTELAAELAGKTRKKKENSPAPAVKTGEQPAASTDTSGASAAEAAAAIKNRYTQAVFFSFTTMEQRALLMQKGAETASNAARYVDRLLILNEADVEELAAVLKTRMQNVPLFWLFSADTKD